MGSNYASLKNILVGNRMQNPKYHIKTLADLRSVVVTNEKQSAALEERLYDHIDLYAARSIADAPLVFFATASKTGHVDVSPKGDARNFWGT